MVLSQVTSIHPAGRFHVRGLSMLGALFPRDELQVELEALSTGDIVAYLSARGTGVAHRLLGVCRQTGELLTRGDTARGDGERVPPHAVLGRVTRVRRSVFGHFIAIPDNLWSSSSVSFLMQMGTRVALWTRSRLVRAMANS